MLDEVPGDERGSSSFGRELTLAPQSQSTFGVRQPVYLEGDVSTSLDVTLSD
jgi:hypothetical protein